MAEPKTVKEETTAPAEDKDIEIEALKKQLAELKAEAAAAIEELKANAAAAIEAQKQEYEAALAEAAKTPGEAAAPVQVVDDGEERVTIRLFKDGGKYKDDVFVAVNGETCVVKRGVPVQIKKKFADVLERSMKQDEATAALIERESSSYAEQAKLYNV